MRSDVLIYLSGPITATAEYTVANNIESAVAVYWHCIRRGLPAFCPHFAAGFAEAFTIPYEQWLEYDFRLIDRATHLLSCCRGGRHHAGRY